MRPKKCISCGKRRRNSEFQSIFQVPRICEITDYDELEKMDACFEPYKINPYFSIYRAQYIPKEVKRQLIDCFRTISRNTIDFWYFKKALEKEGKDRMIITMNDIDGFTINGFVITKGNFIDLICTEKTGGELLLNVTNQLFYRLYGYEWSELEPIDDARAFYESIGYKSIGEFMKKDISNIEKETDKMITKHQNKRVKIEKENNEDRVWFYCENVKQVQMIHDTVLSNEMYMNHGLEKIKCIDIDKQRVYYCLMKEDLSKFNVSDVYKYKLMMLEHSLRLIVFLYEKGLSLNEKVVENYETCIFGDRNNGLYFFFNHYVEYNDKSMEIFQGLLKKVADKFDPKEYKNDPIMKYILKFVYAFVRNELSMKMFRKNFRKINVHLKAFIEKKKWK